MSWQCKGFGPSLSLIFRGGEIKNHLLVGDIFKNEIEGECAGKLLAQELNLGCFHTTKEGERDAESSCLQRLTELCGQC